MSCKHDKRRVGDYLDIGPRHTLSRDYTPIRWCSRCGAIFHKVRLNNGQWSKRARWISPRENKHGLTSVIPANTLPFGSKPSLMLDYMTEEV